MAALTPADGAIDPAVRAEFPDLRLHWVRTPGRAGRSPREVRDRLAALADRVRGPQAVALRAAPVPSAHRVFFRHVGLDPDVRRVPAEEAIVRRLLDGGFPARGLPADALTIAVVQTGVGLWALDAATVQGGLELRRAEEALVVADARGPVAGLFAEPEAAFRVTRRTRELLLYAVQVPGVPAFAVEDAVLTCLEVLGAATSRPRSSPR